jgi:hypothetical protein
MSANIYRVSNFLILLSYMVSSVVNDELFSIFFSPESNVSSYIYRASNFIKFSSYMFPYVVNDESFSIFLSLESNVPTYIYRDFCNCIMLLSYRFPCSEVKDDSFVSNSIILLSYTVSSVVNDELFSIFLSPKNNVSANIYRVSNFIILFSYMFSSVVNDELFSIFLSPKGNVSSYIYGISNCIIS